MNLNDEEIITNITNEILKIAEKENNELLRLTNDEWGFFFMPELAFAYECGKSITSKREEIFGSDSYKWVRETRAYKATGPVDLIFKSDNNDLPPILIEFKLNDKDYKYLSDISKLQKISVYPSIKLFCSCKHIYENQYKKFQDKQKYDCLGMANLIIDKRIKTQMRSRKDDYILFSMWRVSGQ